jgi:hypothetical protein
MFVLLFVVIVVVAAVFIVELQLAIDQTLVAVITHHIVLGYVVCACVFDLVCSH